MRIFVKALVYAFAITLAILIVNSFVLSQEQAEQVKAIDPPPLQMAQIQFADEKLKRAQVEMENARLHYILAVHEARIALKLGAEYEWSDQLRKFILKAAPPKEKEKQ